MNISSSVVTPPRSGQASHSPSATPEALSQFRSSPPQSWPFCACGNLLAALGLPPPVCTGDCTARLVRLVERLAAEGRFDSAARADCLRAQAMRLRDRAGILAAAPYMVGSATSAAACPHGEDR